MRSGSVSPRGLRFRMRLRLLQAGPDRSTSRPISCSPAAVVHIMQGR